VQLAASVAVPAVHEAARHDVEAPGYAQLARSVPSQLPPQALPSEAQAERPTGAPVTAVQTPTWPARLQASHWPVQPPSQQTPSTQLPVPHWFAAVQAWPGVFLGWQTPALHQSPLTHCASPLQEARQAVAPHTYGEQVCVTRLGHVPEPSQDAARVPVPAAQDAARQEVEAVGYVQVRTFVPLQLPPQAEPSERQEPRGETGAPVTGQQVPTWPPTLQASHWPVQPPSQQTPSTQLPVPHWFPAVQAWPAVFFGWQTPALHQSPPTHCASPLQEARQAVAPHT
jgi:hypothetical protein